VRTLVALGLLIGMCAPAMAQDNVDRMMEPEIQTGTRFKQAPETAQEKEARDLQKRVARCVTYRNKKQVRQLLINSDYDRIRFEEAGIEPATMFDDLDVGDCLGRAMKHSTYRIHMRMPLGTLRNLLTEEVYLMDNKKPMQLASDAPKYLEVREAERRLGPRAGVLAELADCVTHTDIAAADELLRNRPGSEGESEALEALYPAFAQCGLETSEDSNLDKSMIRSVLADGLWARSYYGSEDFSAAGEGE